MPLPSSGAISLNQLHIEVGASSGTTCSLNDSDIRNLINKASGAQSSFSEFYGASASYNRTVTVGNTTTGSGYITFQFYGYATSYGLSQGAQGGLTPNNDASSLFGTGARIAQIGYFTSGAFQLIIDAPSSLSNSGWTSITVGSTTFNRTSATVFTNAASSLSGSAGYMMTWSFQGAGNPFGTTAGATVAVSIT